MRRVGVRASPPGLLQALGILMVALAMLVWAPGVFAHASLIASTPTAGAVLPQAPASVRLTFNEPVSPLVFKIIQPDGSVKDIAQTEVLPAGLEVLLPVLDQQGAYGLSWRVVSADGHPVGGTVAFSVGVKGASSGQESLTHPGREALIWLSRLGGYVGLFFGIGLAVCRALTSVRDDKRRLAFGLLMLGAAATLFNVGLLGIDALDRPVSALLGADPWRTAFSTSFGLSAALALAALTCAALVWHAAATLTRKLLALAALIMLGASLAASGHASGAPPIWLARPAVWLHAVAITLWIGSLLPLAYSLQEPMGKNLLKRFSRLIPVVLLMLFFSGGVLIYLQFDTPSSLWLTAYGQVLALKLALLAVLVGLGAYNRYRLMNAVLDGQRQAHHAMRRVIYMECMLAIVILAVAALWRFTPPPRALNSTPAASTLVSAHIHTRAVMASLSLTSPVRGQAASLTLYLSKADLTPLVAQEVDVAFSSAQAGVEPIVFSAKHASDDTWRVAGIELPNLPAWHIRIDALITDFERISLETTLNIEE
ncbi:copper resistance CopC/CopD family protein [Pusillimonas noertemannii]|nr:copper resistance protein CopC [Pusillimonas noertemannii]